MYVWLVRLRGGVRVVKIDRQLGEAIARRRRARGRRHRPATPIARRALPPLPAELRASGPQWVVFSTEYCAVCPSVVAEIESRRPGEAVTVLDVAEHLDLASRYKVRRAPTVLRVAADGSIVARLSGVDAVRAELGALPAGA